MSDGVRWESFHIDLRDDIYSTECDRILRECVAPLIALLRHSGLVEQYFFIRYKDPGHHIRLRLSCTSRDRRQLRSRLHAAAARVSDRITGVREVPYEPEYERYGGEVGVRLSERFFRVSSEVTLAHLVDQQDDLSPDQRLGLGLFGVLVILHSLLDGERELMSVIAERHTRGLLMTRFRDGEKRNGARTRFDESFRSQAERVQDQVQSIIGACDQGTIEEFHIARYELKELRRDLLRAHGASELPFGSRQFEKPPNALGHLLGSYLHMHCNRLGIAPAEECFLAYACAMGLRETGVPS